MKKVDIALISVITALVLIVGSFAFWYFDSGVAPLDQRLDGSRDELREITMLGRGCKDVYFYMSKDLGSYWGHRVVIFSAGRLQEEKLGDYEIAGVPFSRNQFCSYIYVIKGEKLYNLRLAYEMGILKKRHLKIISKRYYMVYERVGVPLQEYTPLGPDDLREDI